MFYLKLLKAVKNRTGSKKANKVQWIQKTVIKSMKVFNFDNIN